jgi:hypothetical protein
MEESSLEIETGTIISCRMQFESDTLKSQVRNDKWVVSCPDDRISQ